jgi:hypothetical protein
MAIPHHPRPAYPWPSHGGLLSSADGHNSRRRPTIPHPSVPTRYKEELPISRLPSPHDQPPPAATPAPAASPSRSSLASLLVPASTRHGRTPPSPTLLSRDRDAVPFYPSGTFRGRGKRLSWQDDDPLSNEDDGEYAPSSAAHYNKLFNL